MINRGWVLKVPKEGHSDRWLWCVIHWRHGGKRKHTPAAGGQWIKKQIREDRDRRKEQQRMEKWVKCELRKNEIFQIKKEQTKALFFSSQNFHHLSLFFAYLSGCLFFCLLFLSFVSLFSFVSSGKCPFVFVRFVRFVRSSNRSCSFVHSFRIVRSVRCSVSVHSTRASSRIYRLFAFSNPLNAGEKKCGREHWNKNHGRSVRGEKKGW